VAVRTVRVVLTGTVTPYTTAMRNAARTTTQTAGQIGASMRAATLRATAAMTAMARSAQAQAARAGASIQSMAARASAAMSTLAARTAAATRGALSPVPGLAARASAAFSGLAARGAAAFGVVRGAAARAAAAVGGAMPPAAARAAAALTAAGARATAAAAAVAARWSTAAAAVSARWSAAGAAVTAAMATARASAGAAAGWVATRWRAAAAAVTGAMSSMRLAAFAAGAGILAVANDGTKALRAMRAASLGLVAAFGLAAFAAARFDKSMSEVRAVTGGSVQDMAKLKQAALDAGQATIYSATQAAKAEAELARAGITTADIISGALQGALDLAASGQLELAEAAIISAQAMNAFKLEGADVGHIADVISAGAGKSATNVHHMGMAFRQAALLSSQTGLSLEETVGTLAMFAQNALTGSDAGTSLKVMLQRLVPQSKEAAAMMDQIGFSAYDAQGNFVGLHALSEMMKTSFSKLTPEARNAAMATIFGSDAVRAATILYEAGAKGVDSWVAAVDDTGYATRVAATMTDNLSGDLERLKGALETALISSGSAANGVLRNMAQVLTSVVNWYGRLSPSVQSSVTVMAGLLGMVGLVGSALLLMLPRIMAVRAELVALGVTAVRVRAAMMMLGRLGLVVTAIAGVSYGVSKLMQQFQDAPPNVAKMANALVDFAQKGKIAGEMSKTFGKDLDGVGEAVARIAHPSALKRTKDFFSTFDPFGKTDLDTSRDKIKAIDEALTSLVQSGATKEAAENFKRFAAEAEAGGTSTAKFKTLLPQYVEALTATDTQNKVTAGSQEELAEAAGLTADEMADTRSEAEKLTDALKTLNGVAIGAAQAEIGFRSSLADLNEVVKENGHSLDVSSDKGRKVKGAFLEAAKAAMEHAEAVAEQSGSVEAGNAILEADIAVLRRTMKQAGFTDKQIRGLTDAYAQLPGAKQTKVTAPGAQKSISDLETLRAKVMAVPPGKSIIVKAPTNEAVRALRAAGYAVEAIRGTKNVRITAPTGSAVRNAQALRRELDRLRNKYLTITTERITIFRNVQRGGGSNQAAKNAYETTRARGGLIRGYANGGPVQGFPFGGRVYGPGTSISDSIDARLSKGEFVIKAAAVRRYGATLFEQLNAMRMPAPAYGGGGIVSGSRFVGGSAPAAQAAAMMRAVVAEVVSSAGFADGQQVTLVVKDGPTLQAYVDRRADSRVGKANGELLSTVRAGRKG
jgi:TP901 family phage tail tape measure protein